MDYIISRLCLSDEIHERYGFPYVLPEIVLCTLTVLLKAGETDALPETKALITRLDVWIYLVNKPIQC